MSKKKSSRRRWRQGVWTARDQAILLAVLLWQAIVRGVDYVKGTGPQSVDYLLLEAAFSQQALGFAFIIPAVMITVGMAWRFHGLVWAGHSLLMVTYFTISLSLLWTSAFLLPSASHVLALALMIGLGTVLGWMVVSGAICRHPMKALAIFATILILLFWLPQAPDGSLRAPGFYLSVGLCHLLWAARMGPSPLAKGDATLDEAVVKG